MILPSGLKIRIDLSRVPVPVILYESGESRNTSSQEMAKKKRGAIFLTSLPLSTLRLRSEYGFTKQRVFTAKTQRTLSDKKRGLEPDA
jgi:hypothetical protein